MKSGFTAIIGRPNVGKSTLLNQILGQKIVIATDKAQTTRKRIKGIYTTEQGQIVFIDTPGVHKPLNKLGEFLLNESKMAVPDADLILFLVDGAEPAGKGDKWIAQNLLQTVVKGYAIARIGCLLNGCCYGLPTNVAWAMNAAGDGILRHPTQIYASLSGLVIFAILVLFDRRRNKADGQSMVLFIGLYSIGRFIVEFFRVAPRNYFAPFTITQVVCMGIALIAFTMFVLIGRNARYDGIEM